MLLGEVSVVHELEGNQVLKPARRHLATTGKKKGEKMGVTLLLLVVVEVVMVVVVV